MCTKYGSDFLSTPLIRCVCVHTKLPANRYWRAQKCQTERPWTMYSHFQHIHKSSYHNVKQNLYLNCMLWSFRLLFIWQIACTTQTTIFRSTHTFGWCCCCFCVGFPQFWIFLCIHRKPYGKINKTNWLFFSLSVVSLKKTAKFQTLFFKHRWHDMANREKNPHHVYDVNILFDLKLTINRMENEQCLIGESLQHRCDTVSLTNYLLLFTIVFSYDLCHKLNFRTFELTHSVRMFFNWKQKLTLQCTHCTIEINAHRINWVRAYFDRNTIFVGEKHWCIVAKHYTISIALNNWRYPLQLSRFFFTRKVWAIQRVCMREYQKKNRCVYAKLFHDTCRREKR